MSISDETFDRMMFKCGRRCCICRTFRPTKLQVHHIAELAQGGSDDDDNLVVTCSSCYSDIHTQTPLSRRFTNEELKGQREALDFLVSAGRLPEHDVDDAQELISRVVNHVRTSQLECVLSPAAVKILLSAAFAEEGMQGMVQFVQHDGGFVLLLGGNSLNVGDRREQARFKAGLEQLIQLALLSPMDGHGCTEVTEGGYLAAEELAADTDVESS